MMLFGIASIMAAFALILFGMASLCKAIGAHLPEKVRELTEEEKEALRAQAEASKAYSEGIANIMAYGASGGSL